MKSAHLVSMFLVIIGALNWGLIGSFGPQANIVTTLLENAPAAQRIVYILIGLAAVYLILTYNKYCAAVYKLYKN